MAQLASELAGVSGAGEEERWVACQEPTASPSDSDPTTLQPKLSGDAFVLRLLSPTLLSFCPAAESGPGKQLWAGSPGWSELALHTDRDTHPRGL